MSTFNAQTNTIYTHEDKENSIIAETTKKGKGDFIEKQELSNTIERIDEDQEENRLMDAKRKRKFHSVQNFKITLIKCSEESE